jgi:hypothetical protein
VETFIINPLECNHAPAGVNSFKGGHDHDQVSRDSQAKKSGTQSAEHCRQLQCLQENGQSRFETCKGIKYFLATLQILPERYTYSEIGGTFILI